MLKLLRCDRRRAIFSRSRSRESMEALLRERSGAKPSWYRCRRRAPNKIPGPPQPDDGERRLPPDQRHVAVRRVAGAQPRRDGIRCALPYR